MTRSRPLVGIGVELADDGGDARLRAREMVAAVAVAREPAGLTQRIQCAGDLAAVVAADGLDDVGVEHRGGRERELDGLKARRAGKHLCGAPAQRNLAFTAERGGGGEGRLCPARPARWG